MTPRLLGILLAVSLALNAFAVAGGVAAWMQWKEIEARVSERLPRRGGPFGPALAQLEPETRERVLASMREAALAARPDFEAARAARREAVALSQAAVFDPAAVAALLEQSRQAEVRGRGRLEGAMLETFETLTPEERAVLSPVLSRRMKGLRGAERSGPPPSA
ncbi:periplasmic heavy metal sensor [Brevundimonas balnearis]|uniref:Periplasmic heavy metal sensor n=1 Tax=Brevundimonas balnearis TaxID=1572858 RepID=A0ABV6R1A8_9CAUL